MGDAYTPGLTVTGQAVVRKLRRLPLPGTVLVSVGQKVRAADVVARTELPGKVTLINFANILGVLPDELEAKLLVKEGDKIAKQQVLGEHRSFFGLSRAVVQSPIDGTQSGNSRRSRFHTLKLSKGRSTYLKLLNRTTSLFSEPREETIRLPSPDQLNQNI